MLLQYLFIITLSQYLFIYIVNDCKLFNLCHLHHNQYICGGLNMWNTSDIYFTMTACVITVLCFLCTDHKKMFFSLNVVSCMLSNIYHWLLLTSLVTALSFNFAIDQYLPVKAESRPGSRTRYSWSHYEFLDVAGTRVCVLVCMDL